jgi:hypothetical protein
MSELNEEFYTLHLHSTSKSNRVKKHIVFTQRL